MENNVLDERLVSQFSPTQLNTYFGLYLKNAKELVEGIEKDYQANNMEVMRKRAHKLKGSSMTVGATSVREKAHAIEDAIKANAPVSEAMVADLKKEFDALKQALKEKYNIAP
jgi:HPt (histidine-containing phosphotransfer) domain-containing protein